SGYRRREHHRRDLEGSSRNGLKPIWVQIGSITPTVPQTFVRNAGLRPCSNCKRPIAQNKTAPGGDTRVQGGCCQPLNGILSTVLINRLPRSSSVYGNRCACFEISRWTLCRRDSTSASMKRAKRPLRGAAAFARSAVLAVGIR